MNERKNKNLWFQYESQRIKIFVQGPSTLWILSGEKINKQISAIAWLSLELPITYQDELKTNKKKRITFGVIISWPLIMCDFYIALQ